MTSASATLVPLICASYDTGQDTIQFEVHAEIFDDVAGWGAVLGDMVDAISRIELTRFPGRHTSRQEVRQQILVAVFARLAEAVESVDLPSVGEA